MSGGSTTRNPRQARPGIEGLEDRLLLDAQAGGGVSASATPTPTPAAASAAVTATATKSKVPLADRQIHYTTPEGSRVVVTLYGIGNLKGSYVDPDGALNLRFAGTNEQTGIVGKVVGGTGRAPIRSLLHSAVPAQSLSGIGGSLVNVVNLHQFDLVDNGRVNLTAGVHDFFLNSVGRNTQVSLRELPAQFLTPSSTATSATENGVTLGFALDVTGARTLSTTAGTFVPGFNLFPTAVTVNGVNTHAAPPGLVAVINKVNGPARGSAGLGDAQLYGYDPSANALVRFDVATGNPTLTIPNALPNPVKDAGVALGRNNGKLVVLVSDGQAVQAYDPTSGTKVGQFGLASLAPLMTNPTRLGTLDSATVIGDTAAGNGSGVIQILDVTRSLASGQAVAIGVPFAATREFGLSGGMSGLPGSSTLYAAGGAHFDQFQPDKFQLGLDVVNPTAPQNADLALAKLALRESSRSALTSQGRTRNTDSRGGTGASANNALGAIDLNLALVTGVFNDATTGAAYNDVSLYNAQTFTKQGDVRLNYPSLLSGLSVVFRPALAGSALVDVQGNIQSFRSHSAQGLVLNDTGNLNLAKIDTAADTTIVAFPFGHAEIPHRSNVTILSSARVVNGRNGVTVLPTAQPTGPLSLP